MGLKLPPLPDDYGFGDDCLGCWDEGKTPSHLFAVFYDVTDCDGCPPSPMGRTFLLTQDEFDSCLFFGSLDYEGVTWWCYYHSHYETGNGPRSNISLYGEISPCSASFYDEAAACTRNFLNNHYHCNGIVGGENGEAHVIVMSHPIIRALTSEYHFVTLPGFLYEFDDCGMDHRWYRICHKKDHTNIMILLDVEDLELPR